jgi:hypothetical protein
VRATFDFERVRHDGELGKVGRTKAEADSPAKLEMPVADFIQELDKMGHGTGVNVVVRAAHPRSGCPSPVASICDASSANPLAGLLLKWGGRRDWLLWCNQQ